MIGENEITEYKEKALEKTICSERRVNGDDISVSLMHKHSRRESFFNSGYCG
jgi:hypothetical protein